MAQLYRKAALERISSPDQLDKAIRVTSPASWLALIGITLILVVVIVWSIVGTIPTTVSAPGIISSPVGTNAIFTSDSGKVISVNVYEGAEVHFGDVILTYYDGNQNVKEILADQVGTVSQVLVNPEDSITQGNEVVRISPVSQGSQIAICYMPLSLSKKVERGMQAQVYLDSVDSQTYGHMVCRVVNVDTRASSNAGMSYVLGNDNNLAAAFTKDGPVVAVACEFYPGDTESGYFWSNEKGSTVKVSNGSTVTVKIVTERVPPITKLFSKLKEIWGN